MAPITTNQLKTMDYQYLGTPFVWAAATPALNLKTMDYQYLGTPFVANAPGLARSFGYIFG